MMRRLHAFALLCSCAYLTLVGCQRSAEPEPIPAPCPEVDAGTPVDKVLLAFLGKARAAHHAADLLEDNRDLAGAARTLQQLLDPPAQIPDRPEAHEVVADTRARLADLKSQLGNFDDAAREVDSGLALVGKTTYYRGHLLEMRGLVKERQAKAVRKQGDELRAKQIEAEALDAFEQSMKVQQAVIDQTLPNAPKPSNQGAE